MKFLVISLMFLLTNLYSLSPKQHCIPGLTNLEPISAENVGRLRRLDIACAGVVFSSHGSFEVSLGEWGGNTVHLCDVATGNVTMLEGRENFSGVIQYMAFSSDESIMVIGGDGVTQIWNVSTGEQFPDLEAQNEFVIYYVALSPDGHLVASGELTGPMVQLWDVKTGKRLGVWRLLEAVDTDNSWDVDEAATRVRDIAFSPGGTILVAAGGNSVELWDVVAGDKLALLRDNWATSVAFSPDGTVLASGSKNGIKLWSVSSSGNTTVVDSLFALDGHPGHDLAFSPDGTMLAGGGWKEDVGYSVGLWNRARGELLHVLEFEKVMRFIGAPKFGFGLDGSILVAGNAIWDTMTGDALVVFERADGGIALSPDGKLLSVVVGDEIQMWGVPSNE